MFRVLHPARVRSLSLQRQVSIRTRERGRARDVLLLVVEVLGCCAVVAVVVCGGGGAGPHDVQVQLAVHEARGLRAVAERGLNVPDGIINYFFYSDYVDYIYSI